MEKNLAVPYLSQHGNDSKVSNNDCGAASLAMVLSYLLSQNLLTGDILKELGNPTGYISFPQLTQVARNHGLVTKVQSDVPFNEIKKSIDQGLPVIVVGGYGHLKSVQDTNFKGSHIMVVVGYRPDDSVYCNDPDFWGDYLKDGDHHVYTFEEFSNFWRNEGNTDQNPPNLMMVVSKPEVQVNVSSDTKVSKVAVSCDSLVARSKPVIDQSTRKDVYKKGRTFDVDSVAKGDSFQGSNDWYKLTNGLYIWAGGTEVLERTAIANVSIPTHQPAANPTVVNIAPPSDYGEYVKAMQSIYLMTQEFLTERNALPPQASVQSAKFGGLWQTIKNILHL